VKWTKICLQIDANDNANDNKNKGTPQQNRNEGSNTLGEKLKATLSKL
jgi:hypothetical protein